MGQRERDLPDEGPLQLGDTLTKVQRGIVAVRDTVKNRTVLVTAGRSYFAEAPAPKQAKAKPKAKPKKPAKKRSR